MQHLQKILDGCIDRKKIFGCSFAIKKEGFQWQGAAGDLNINQKYFIASTTKLFTTALILKFREKGWLDIDNTGASFLGPNLFSELHQFEGKAYGQEISIRHLLSHTSGLPDYFQDKNKDARSLEDEIKQGRDLAWTFEEAMERTRSLPALFPPGWKNKAHYSDANFQILGKVIEHISGKSYEQCCQEYIFEPLGLNATYLYHHIEDKAPKTLYYKEKELHIPKAMASFGPDGGMVSNASDMLMFTEAFFRGALFPVSYLEEMQSWRRIFFPMQSGLGIHLFKLPWFFNPFGTVPSFIGHSGLSGALAFYCPAKNLFITGTVNQVAHPELSFRTMIKLAQAVK